LDAQWRADLFQIINEFRNSVVSNLFNDLILDKIYRHIIKKIKKIKAIDRIPIIIQKLFRFDLKNKLFYQIRSHGHEKLYILFKLHRIILEYIYDKIIYQDITRICDRFRLNIYILRLRKIIEKYINTYPNCGVFKLIIQLPIG
jgi:hypothetical protein